MLCQINTVMASFEALHKTTRLRLFFENSITGVVRNDGKIWTVSPHTLMDWLPRHQTLPCAHDWTHTCPNKHTDSPSVYYNQPDPI